MAESAVKAGVKSEVVVNSSQLKAEKLEIAAGHGIEWQRCAVADRSLVVVEGSGYLYRTRGRDEVREDIGAGDVRYVPRMIWHRVVAAPDRAITVAIVTCAPAEVEVRR